MRIFQETKYSQLTDEENPILSNNNNNNNNNIENNEPKSKKSRFNSELLSKMIFYTLILGVFAVLVHSIVKVLMGHYPELDVISKSLTRFTMNNGTHIFAPTVILISLDGFRPDYLNTNNTPNMEKFNTKAPYMTPSFPSITFPNHYTLVTGLYPESHGIVGNSFFDPTLKKTFYYTHPQDSHDSFWWGGEPIWVTAEKNNVKTAVHMWPGCESIIQNYKPTYMEAYSKKFTLTQKMDQVLGWLDLPSQDRPGFIGVYVSDVDTAGHDHGPDSDFVKEKVQNVDQMIGYLTEGLKSRNLKDIVNTIIVSDHGMAHVDNNKIIYLDDYIDTDLIAQSHLYPLAGIIPKDLSKVQDIYNQLKRKLNSTSKWNVYLREEIPDHFHFKNNLRIPPIVGIQESGWAFTTHKEYPDPTQPFHPAGLHGYDNTHPDMRALFIANGPYFDQLKGQDIKPLAPFQNLEVYGVLTDILEVEFAPNNGTQLLSHYFKPSISA